MSYLKLEEQSHQNNILLDFLIKNSICISNFCSSHKKTLVIWLYLRTGRRKYYSVHGIIINSQNLFKTTKMLSID